MPLCEELLAALRSIESAGGCWGTQVAGLKSAVVGIPLVELQIARLFATFANNSAAVTLPLM